MMREIQHGVEGHLEETPYKAYSLFLYFLIFYFLLFLYFFFHFPLPQKGLS